MDHHRYKGWRLSEPTIATLADGSGYTVLNVDISREDGRATETKALLMPGKWPSKASASTAAIENTKHLIDTF